MTLAALIFLCALCAFAVKAWKAARAQRDYWLTRARAAELHRDLMRRHAAAMERLAVIRSQQAHAWCENYCRLKEELDGSGEAWKRGG